MSVPDIAALEAAVGRALGGKVPVHLERTTSGVSGLVYRLTQGSAILYVRVAERVTDHLEVEEEILRKLAARGVSVPSVVFVEHFDAALQRSFMIMRELPGEPLDRIRSPAQAAHVVRRAGRDLALLGQISVHGFGFIRRDLICWPPHAEFTRWDEFVRSSLPGPWPGYLADVFSPLELDTLSALVDSECARPDVMSQLAHGDFDVTPIFQFAGRYTGLIDFGELRGADAFFDLGHFLLHDRETSAFSLFEHLYAGYSEVVPPGEGDRSRIAVSGVLLGLRQLCRWRGYRDWPPHHPLVVARIKRIREMLGTPDMRPVM